MRHGDRAKVNGRQKTLSKVTRILHSRRERRTTDEDRSHYAPSDQWPPPANKDRLKVETGLRLALDLQLVSTLQCRRSATEYESSRQGRCRFRRATCNSQSLPLRLRSIRRALVIDRRDCWSAQKLDCPPCSPLPSRRRLFFLE